MPSFVQEGPSLGNVYLSDRVLRSFLRRVLPAKMLSEIEPDLRRFGQRVAGEILVLGQQAERQRPEHVPFDPWGNRIDEIRVSEAWKKLDAISAEEGLVAIGYQREHGEFSRLYQFTKLYLFSPQSAYYTCPLAMTDGAARALELYGDETLKKRAFAHLTSTEPGTFWTSGQWMTERAGGSDVAETETVARLENGEYRLYGAKWFTSATTSPMAMTLARIVGADGKTVPGSKGLSLFYLELRDPDGSLNGIRVDRLKDKLGTRALPTAELTLDGSRAVLVGGEGGGVRKISSLFNITRLYNACVAVASMRRAIDLATSYATRRRAFGKLLIEHPLHVETLAQLELEATAGFHLTFRLLELLGKDETGRATESESAILRLLTPIAKLWTAKQAVAVVSEVLECVGGAAYVEDTGLPVLLRDTQVLSIWEGTTNILSLDMLRALAKESAAGPFFADLRARLDAVTAPALAESREKARQAAQRIEDYLAQATAQGEDFVQAGARALAFSMARTYSASLLLEQAQWSLKNGAKDKDRRASDAAVRWCKLDLCPLIQPDPGHRNVSRSLIQS